MPSARLVPGGPRSTDVLAQVVSDTDTGVLNRTEGGEMGKMALGLGEGGELALVTWRPLTPSSILSWLGSSHHRFQGQRRVLGAEESQGRGSKPSQEPELDGGGNFPG